MHRMPLRTLSILLACCWATTQTVPVSSPPILNASGPHAPGARFEARLEVRMEPGWHLSSLTQPESGPVPAAIEIPKRQPFRFAGPILADAIGREPNRVVGYDPQQGPTTWIARLERRPSRGGPLIRV